MEKKKEAAHFCNSLMIPIWKVLRAAQATEIKCKRPLRLEVCKLGIITLCAFEKGKAVSTPGGRECKHRAVLWEADASARSDAKVGPGGTVVCKLNSGQPGSLAGWKGSPGWGCLRRRVRNNSASADISSWAAPGATHCAPTTSLGGKLRQFGRSAENSNKSEWIQEPEERTRIEDEKD